MDKIDSIVRNVQDIHKTLKSLGSDDGDNYRPTSIPGSIQKTISDDFGEWQKKILKKFTED